MIILVSGTKNGLTKKLMIIQSETMQDSLNQAIRFKPDFNPNNYENIHLSNINYETYYDLTLNPNPDDWW